MKNIIILLICIFTSLSTSAQFKIGQEVGMQIGSISRDVNSFTVTNNIRVGVRAGLVSDIAINDNFSVQPGLFYTTRSTKSVADFFIFSVEQSFSVNYLELPINFQYKSGTPDKGRVFIGVGPYIAYALGGKSKIEIPNNNPFIQNALSNPLVSGLLNDQADVSVGTDTTDAVRPFDIGANINFGYELPVGLFFRGQIGMGFMNTAPLDDLITQKNWGGAITIGYFFNLARKPDNITAGE